MKIWDVTDAEFKKYGRVLDKVDWDPLIKAMRETPLPDGVDYEPSVPALEATPMYQELKTRFYGELPIQIGYCNGHNCMLNAVEYHRSSEVDVAATDMILLLGKQRDITESFTYDTSLIEAFLAPAGTAVELYADTLHYAPCDVDDKGFKVAIVLPKDTNLPLDKEHGRGEDDLMTAKNKWLIGHVDADFPEGTHLGLIGKNISIKD